MSGPETIDRFITACRDKDERLAAGYFSDRGIFREPDREPIVGRAAIEAHFGKFFHGGPQWRWTVSEMFEAGDRCVVVYRFGLLGSNGEWREHDGCAIASFDRELIAEWREFRG
jgi:hypothetical protein